MINYAKLAAECAARHHTPKATVTHPEVVVPGDPFMTMKLKDPDYVPYCMGAGCGRTRRTAFGFQCPTCGNKANFDLTRYDGNRNVQYVGAAPALSVKEWNAQVDARRAAKKRDKNKEIDKP